MHDDKLILYYYDDGLPERERKQITTALENDATLAARYEEIQRRLGDIVDTDDTPAPASAVHRWHDSIDRAARREFDGRLKSETPFNFMSFFWGAMTAALAIGIGIGVYLSGETIVPPDPQLAAIDTVPVSAATTSAAFTRGLQIHLRNSQREISRLPVGADAERTLLLMHIIEQNRFFERVAEQKNSPKLARVLRAFEPVFLRLAAEDLSPEDVEALREQLAFELNVMLTKLTREASVKPQSI